MSLLYECINGIIQGGILEGAEGTTEGEEVARLCVGKLRSMLVVEGDPNRTLETFISLVRLILTSCSQIRCPFSLPEDRRLASSSRLSTSRRYSGVH
jgi:hypothetical protein